jgi:hemerythrin-like domain-containing protein
VHHWRPEVRLAKTTIKKRPIKKSKTATVKSPSAAAVRGTAAGVAAAVADSMPWSDDKSPDAINLLEADHRRLEDLFKQGEDTTGRATKKRREILEKLTRELNAHEVIEEKILYPSLKQHPAAKDIVLEGLEEHHVADVIVKELVKVSPGDEQWAAKFKVLKENIEHHIEEEEGTMFRAARGIFSREELREMGARMQKLKAETLRA